MMVGHCTNTLTTVAWNSVVCDPADSRIYWNRSPSGETSEERAVLADLPTETMLSARQTAVPQDGMLLLADKH